MTTAEDQKSDRAWAPALRRAAPVEAAAYTAFAETVMKREDGAIPVKYRELIAIGVAVTTQCKLCLNSHVKAAKAAGASKEEIAEASFVAAALRAGGAFCHGFAAMRYYED